MIGRAPPGYIEGRELPLGDQRADDALEAAFTALRLVTNLPTVKNLGWREAGACLRGARTTHPAHAATLRFAKVQAGQALPHAPNFNFEPICDIRSPYQIKLRLDVLHWMCQRPVTPIPRKYTQVPFENLVFNCKAGDPHNWTMWSNARTAVAPTAQNCCAYYQNAYAVKVQSMARLEHLGFVPGNIAHATLAHAYHRTNMLLIMFDYQHCLPGLRMLDAEMEQERARLVQEKVGLAVDLCGWAVNAINNGGRRGEFEGDAQEREFFLMLELAVGFDPTYFGYRPDYFARHQIAPLAPAYRELVRSHRVVLEMYQHSQYLSCSTARRHFHRLGAPVRNPFATQRAVLMDADVLVLNPPYVEPGFEDQEDLEEEELPVRHAANRGRIRAARVPVNRPDLIINELPVFPR